VPVYRPQPALQVNGAGYCYAIRLRIATAMTALALVGCGSSSPSGRTRIQATVPHLPRPHAQVVEPVAGKTPQAASTASVPEQLPATVPGHDPAPTGPATKTSAPAKGAPTDAQVRAAIARFQLAVSRYHLNQLDFSGVLLDPAQLPAGVWNVSIASVETAYGHAVACGGVLRVPELGVANKTLPCGTEVTFRYGNRAIRVPVIDRGPYIPGREWDLSGATAEALHFPGLGPIQWRLG
jgi:rare lipoprotein A (peptidoglycan hydrolase)